MIGRRLQTRIWKALTRHAVVGLLGPRQVGKTTLAMAVAHDRPSVYLDLEAPDARTKLDEPVLYFSQHPEELVVLDEIQQMPELFRVLRGVVDAGRRRGHRTGQFLVLGSASLDLLRQSSESLAGRITYLELGPLDVLEIAREDLTRLWVRGGFPESFLAPDEPTSFDWRESFLRTYLQRDIPQFGVQIPAETLRRFWMMLAHLQGGLLNAARIAAALGVSGQSVARYLDLFCDLLLVRRLAPWAENVGKRLVRSPKVFIRDSGLLHALLGLRDQEALVGHPVVGLSWEAFVIENLIQVAPSGTEAFFYRSARGAEIDLLLVLPNRERWAFEIKRSLAPKADRGFYEACKDLSPAKRFLVYPGTERFPMSNELEAIGLFEVATALAEMQPPE